MTAAERLRDLADRSDGTAHHIRWSEPHEARILQRVANELREIAQSLPPERNDQ